MKHSRRSSSKTRVTLTLTRRLNSSLKTSYPGYVAIAIVVYFAINGVSYIDILTSVLGGAS
eukprot:697461-Amorphochlora_amoeboformis.AAC.1